MVALRNTSTQTAVKPIDHFLSLLKYHKAYSRGYICRCPGPNHVRGDRNPSLMVWEDETDGHVGIKCLTGCDRKAICEALHITESDLYIQDEKQPRRTAPQAKLDLIDLIEDKLIPPYIFDQLGVTDEFSHTFTNTKSGKPYTVRNATRIPYHNMDGTEYTRYHIRTALIAKDGSPWNGDSDDPLIPYGLQRLEEARNAGYLVIVEGESDCWTLWTHKLPALGLPGASQYNSLQSEYLAGIAKIFVMQEPDAAGRKLPEEVYKRLQKIGYAGKVYALDLHKETGAEDPNELHKRDMKAFKSEFEKAILRARPLFTPTTFEPKISSLHDLLKKKIDPPRWAIRGLLPEGLTILAGKPKMGKSWMILQMGLALNTGGKALEKIDVEPSDVLYLALEDTERRLQMRALQLLSEEGTDKVRSFDFATEWAKLNEGGVAAIGDWLEKHPQARLVVIDTLAKVKPNRNSKSNIYDEDYKDVAELKKLADTHKCAIVLIHHLRKSGAEDPLDEISGSTGLTGAADNLLVLRRERGQVNAVLHVTGRDVDEQELAITFDNQSGLWTLAGNAENFRLSKERQEIIEVLTDKRVPMTPLDITIALNASRETPKSRESVRYLLSCMVRDGDVSTIDGKYIPNTPNRPNSANTPNSPNREDVHDIPHRPLTGLDEPVEPINNFAVRAVSLENDSPLTGLNGHEERTHSNSVSPVRAVRAHEQMRDHLPDWLNTEMPAWEKCVGINGLQEMVERRAAWYEQQNRPLPPLPTKWRIELANVQQSQNGRVQA